jgi:hypothetical protein
MKILPCRALVLIYEYSRPFTRPNWRESKPIVTTYQLYLNVQIDIFPKHKLLHHTILYNIYNTDWFYMYQYIKYYGLFLYTTDHLHTNIINIDGIQEAIDYYWINSFNIKS